MARCLFKVEQQSVADAEAVAGNRKPSTGIVQQRIGETVTGIGIG